MKNIIVTGGAGFIGSALVRFLINNTESNVLNIDKLTYAGNLEALAVVENHERYQFLKADICDKDIIKKAFDQFQPDVLMHLAAESHVDRSVLGPADFIQTNIIGTYTLLEVFREYLFTKSNCLFLHVSTDEVYGDLGFECAPFTEESPYRPSSPYSASKASSDHLVRSWARTYNLPVIITNCSNNYGPFQHLEKLIPLMINNALEVKPLPIYGDGKQVRDWIYVDDHVEALYKIICDGTIGETYNIGGHTELTNIQIVNHICDILDELAPIKVKYKSLIKHVSDRPGHDVRYAVNISKLNNELGWKANIKFNVGLRKTVEWYLENR